MPGWEQVLVGELVHLRDFFLGRNEVTNAEYKTFVDDDGYRIASYWDPIVENGKPIPWEDAVKRFTDRTGRPDRARGKAATTRRARTTSPCPASVGTKRAAYARFAGQELPTVHHWARGLALATLPWVVPASNFGTAGLVAVGKSGAMSDTGAFDMLGNVREWTATASGDQRVISGAAWSEVYYVGRREASVAPPLDRSASNGFRLAISEDDPAVAARARAPIPPATPPGRWEPVSEEIYGAYGRMLAYEPAALNAGSTRRRPRAHG